MANGIDKYNFERMASKLGTEEFIYNGTKYVSILQATQAAGVQYEMVRRRMAERKSDGTRKWTLQQAIDAPKYARAPLSEAGSVLVAIRTLLKSVPNGEEHAAVLAVVQIIKQYETYLKEKHVQDKP